jgi:5-carboxymethyl-2-hydroxymuconate isomerase
MPHIILEIPKEFDKEVSHRIIDMSQIYLTENLPAKLESFKSRIHKYDSCMVAGRTSKELIHLSIKVLSGRTRELLCHCANELREKIAKFVASCILDNDKYEITLEITELSQAYSK